MAKSNRHCFRILAALILLAICSLCLSGYFFDAKIYTKKLPLANISGGKGNKNVFVPVVRDTDSYDVIILTYMRSGSTFIGKLLGARDDTFYWYEPLWLTHKWKFHSKGQLLCNYGMDGCQNISSASPQSVQNSLKFLLDIYKCDLKGHFNRFDTHMHGSAVFAATIPTNQDLNALSSSLCQHLTITCNPAQTFEGTHAIFPEIGITWKQSGFALLCGVTGAIFTKCMDPYKNCTKCVDDKSRDGNASSTAQCLRCQANPSRDCYNKWIEHCNTATHRAIKVFRLDTSHAKYLLENHKRLKLVQVFRDPRAVISSRNVTKWYYGRNDAPNNITNDAMVLCRRIENDLANAKQLKTLFPDRVKIIQYEDFYDPNRTAVILYEFLNMKMTHYVKKSILAPLKANSPKNRHKRAGFHPDSYRDKLDTSVVLATNKHCKKVFDSLGLRTFNNAKEVKNRNLSVILDKLPYPLD